MRSSNWPLWCLVAALLNARLAFSQTVPTAELSAGIFSFHAKATMGDFIGWTTRARGQLAGAADLAGARGWVEVDVAGFKTGNRQRDGHLLEHVEAQKFPTFRLELASARKDSTSGDTTLVTLVARMTIHGVTRDLELPARVLWDSAGAHLWSVFPLDIRDYALKPPSRFFGVARMDPVVNVRVEVAFGTPAQR